MNGRLWITLGVLALLGAVVLLTLRIDTDARKLLGPDDQFTSALDTPQGRSLTLAIISPSRDLRSGIASEIVEMLRNDSRVTRALAAPPSPSPAFIDWLWRYRFLLAPQDAEALAPEALAAEMRFAKAALTTAEYGALADRFMLDPTGSFRRVIDAVSMPPRAPLPFHDGVLQSRDDRAALVFILLGDAPFDVETEAAFDAALVAKVRQSGAEALLVGARPISARISQHIAGRSLAASVIAGCLVLIWLAILFRSLRKMLVCLAPLALGLCLAMLSVRLCFGSIHVVALGFGGALTGLALDYPIHLLGHRRSRAELLRARRHVAVGAATTAIAFLALLGSGIPALQEVGVFVTIGLAGAAICSGFLVSDAEDAGPRYLPSIRAPLVTAWKPSFLLAVAAASAAALLLTPDRGPQQIITVPAQVIDDVQELSEMVDLPSGRYRIEVSGASLADVLDRQAALAGILSEMEAEGLISRHEMLAAHLPSRAAPGALPPADTLASGIASALIAASLDAGFRAQVIAAYEDGRAMPPPDIRSLSELVDIVSIAPLIRIENDQIIAPVRLWGVAEAGRIAEFVDAGRIEGVAFIDEEARISANLDRLAAEALPWMIAGAALGLLLFFVTAGASAAAMEMALACVSAGLVTAFVASLVTGEFGLLQIMALPLVIGIGIDYGLFLTLSESSEQFAAAVRSVLACASTTMIAFLTMAFSGVSVLDDIGATVSIGVTTMVAVHLVRRRPIAEGRP